MCTSIKHFILKNFKLIFFYILLTSIGLWLPSCNLRKEGCTNPDAINFDSDAKKDDGSCIYDNTNDLIDNEQPEIDIILPLANQPISRSFELHVKVSDNKALQIITCSLSSETIGSAVYYSTTREVSGNEDEVLLTVDLLNEPFVGKHYLLVTCIDSAGNSSNKGLEFNLTDTEGPVILMNNFIGDVNQGEDVTLEVTVSDPGALTSVIAEFYATEFGSPILYKFDETELVPFLPWYDTETFNFSFSTFNAYPGPFEVRLTAKDHSGNMSYATYSGNVQ